MTRIELENKIFHQIQFDAISGLYKTEMLMNIMSLVDEYSKQGSIDFMEKVLKEGWNLHGTLENRFWRLYSEAKTTEELYDRYQQFKTKQDESDDIIIFSDDQLNKIDKIINKTK